MKIILWEHRRSTLIKVCKYAMKAWQRLNFKGISVCVWPCVACPWAFCEFEMAGRPLSSSPFVIRNLPSSIRLCHLPFISSPKTNISSLVWKNENRGYKALESWILRPFSGWRYCFHGHSREIKHSYCVHVHWIRYYRI